MSARQPLLTVLAVCYNHAPFVVECLESIRAQTFQDFELIITDDASGDGSSTLIRDWLAKHRRDARFIAHADNRGLARTLNEALRMVSGKYLARIATDDLWLPAKLERQLAVMESCPERVAVLYGDAHQIRSNGEHIAQRYLASCGISGPGPSGDIFLQLLNCNFVLGVTTMLRTGCLRRVGSYDESLVYEDWDLWLRLAEQFEFVFHDEVQAKYRRVPGSMSRTISLWRSPNQAWSDILILAKVLQFSRLTPRERARTRLRMVRRVFTLARHADPRALTALARVIGI